MENTNDILNTVFIIIICGVLLWGQYGISKASKHDFTEEKK